MRRDDAKRSLEQKLTAIHAGAAAPLTITTEERELLVALSRQERSEAVAAILSRRARLWWRRLALLGRILRSAASPLAGPPSAAHRAR